MKRALLLHLAGTPPSGVPGSRVFPSSTIGVSDLRSVASSAALAYYHAVFAAMKAHGLRPLVTLDRYTLPAAVGEAARYAGFAGNREPPVSAGSSLTSFVQLIGWH